jgi:tetratricopeptide (TPR) repeat protein
MSIEDADKLFSEGKFAEAKVIYKEIISQEPENYNALKQLGKITLYMNKFTKAEELLTKAISLKPKENEPKLLLAEAYYRQDRFQEAANFLNQAGITHQAKRLVSFKDAKPYQIEGKSDVSKIKFLKTDPLPIIQIKVNESETVNFIIDTGAAEVFLDSDFAKEIEAEIHYSNKGTFAGGKTAKVVMGKVDSITFDNITIKNVPVNLMPVRQFSAPIFKETRIDGIIGTVLFYHFLTTLDYVEGELILRNKTTSQLQQFDQEIANLEITEIPFWLTGKHFMVAWGKVNNSKPLLFFVDTGLAGGGFTCPKSTIEEAGIELLHEHATTGMGGGGEVQIIPFIVDELSLGDVVEKNIQGIYAGGKTLGEMAGFHIGGIISHAFFRNYALTFDFTKMRLILQKKS